MSFFLCVRIFIVEIRNACLWVKLAKSLIKTAGNIGCALELDELGWYHEKGEQCLWHACTILWMLVRMSWFDNKINCQSKNKFQRWNRQLRFYILVYVNKIWIHSIERMDKVEECVSNAKSKWNEIKREQRTGNSIKSEDNHISHDNPLANGMWHNKMFTSCSLSQFITLNLFLIAK